MNVLAIGCHPDDLEIGCYGTLAKYVKLGHNVSVCHVANGNLGHVEIMQDELRAMRFQEAENAAKVIGAKHYSVDIGDLYVTAENDELVNRLAAVVREAQPDIIITHSDHDYMNDHMQTYYAALRASFCASLPHYDLTATTPVAPVCPIYHMDPVADEAKYNMIVEKNLVEMLYAMAGLESGASLEGVDLAAAAEAYLLKNGMAAEAIEALKANLK